MFTKEEQLLIDEYNQAEKHNHGLSTQYYLFALYEEMKKCEAETGKTVNFGIPVSKNRNYNPRSCDLNNTKFMLHSKKIEVFYLDETRKEVRHPLDYKLKDFIRDNIFCYALHNDEEKEYFYKNPVLNLKNFKKMVDYIKPINHIHPNFNYLSSSPQKEISNIKLCELDMPLYLTQKREDIKKNIEQHDLDLRRVISRVNKSALLYIIDRIIDEDCEFSFGFVISNDERDDKINAIYEINSKTGEKKQVLKNPSADYIFWHLSMYNKEFLKNENGNIDKNSLNSILESVIKMNEKMTIMVNDRQALNIEVESRVLSSVFKKSPQVSVNNNNKARI